MLLPFHLDSGAMPGNRCFPDITHAWAPQHESWDAGAMDGFVRTHLAIDEPETGPATMAYYERADIPYYYALAEAFTTATATTARRSGPPTPTGSTA